MNQRLAFIYHSPRKKKVNAGIASSQTKEKKSKEIYW